MANTTFRTLNAAAHPGRTAQFPIFAWINVARQRRQLRNMDAHLLKDIGLNSEAARNEAARPFWDVPSHWRG